jgi:tetratricopeptide (TPR) repeat protein
VAINGDLDSAEDALAQVERLGVSTGHSRMVRGLVHLHQGDPQKAITELERAVEQMPESTAARSLLGYAYIDARREYDVEKLSDVVDGFPMRTPEDYLFKARLVAIFDPAHGRRILDEYFGQHRPTALGHVVRSDVLLSQAVQSGNLADARAAVDAARAAQDNLPHNPLVLGKNLVTRIALATALEAGGAQEQADREEVLARAGVYAEELAAFPTVPYALFARFSYLEYRDRTQEALLVGEQASQLTPDFVLNYASLLYRCGRFDDAHAVCQGQDGRATQVSSNAAWAYVLLAVGQERKAEEAYQRVAQELPDRIGSVMVLYSHTVPLLMGNKARAREGFNRLQSEGPRLPRWRENWYHELLRYNCGDPKFAENELLAAAGESRWNQCEAHYFLGLNYLADGDREQAKRHFRLAEKTRVFFYFDYAWSRAFLKRLEEDPGWPPWIPATN